MVKKNIENFKLDRAAGGALPCVYNWGWSTLTLQRGQTNSCHRTQNFAITPKNFKNFHNTQGKINARQSMLRSQWPGGGCEYCRDIEHAGGISDRMDVALEKHYDDLIPIQNKDDRLATKTDPTMVEVYFTNVCNMSCIYCGPGYSNIWAQEIKKHSDDTSIDYQLQELEALLPKNQQQALVKTFFKWLDRKGQSLQQLRILGGEPFFQKETYRVIEFLKQKPHPNLNLVVFSNLKVPYEKFKDTVDTLQRLKESGNIENAVITCSIDCWGPQGEYIRTGLDLDQWEKNFAYLVQSTLALHLHGTMNSLSIQTLAELLQRRNHYATPERSIAYSSNVVVSPWVLIPGHWPAETFDAWFETAFKHMTDSEERIHRGYKKQIDGAPVVEDIAHKTRAWLSAMDRRRGTDWQKAFPWLVNY